MISAHMVRIIIIFAGQATRILDNIGNVFRVVVPLVLYFIIFWLGTFVLVYKLTQRRGEDAYGYEMAVVQVSLGLLWSRGSRESR